MEELGGGEESSQIVNDDVQQRQRRESGWRDEATQSEMGGSQGGGNLAGLINDIMDIENFQVSLRVPIKKKRLPKSPKKGTPSPKRLNFNPVSSSMASSNSATSSPAVNLSPLLLKPTIQGEGIPTPGNSTLPSEAAPILMPVSPVVPRRPAPKPPTLMPQSPLIKRSPAPATSRLASEAAPTLIPQLPGIRASPVPPTLTSLPGARPKCVSKCPIRPTSLVSSSRTVPSPPTIVRQEGSNTRSSLIQPVPSSSAARENSKELGLITAKLDIPVPEVSSNVWFESPSLHIPVVTTQPLNMPSIPPTPIRTAQSANSQVSSFTSGAPTPPATSFTPIIFTMERVKMETSDSLPRLAFSQCASESIPSAPSSSLQPPQHIDQNLNIHDEDAWPVLARDLEDIDVDPCCCCNNPCTGNNNDYPDPKENWRKNLSLLERYNYLRTSTMDKHKRYLDVTFEVGPKEETMRAHRLLLDISCDFFRKSEAGGGPSRNSSSSPIKLPTLDPVAFQIFLDYIYTGELHINEGSRVKAILTAATAMCCQQLIDECNLSFGKTPSVDNAVELYHQSLMEDDEVLKRSSLAYISKNPQSVLFSDGVLKSSKEALVSLLDCDEWHLDELEVFKAVKRWAKNQIPGEEYAKAEAIKKRALLREALGAAIYSIRLVSLDSSRLVLNQEMLLSVFEKEEINEFVLYFVFTDNKQKRSPPTQFNNRTRRRTGT